MTTPTELQDRQGDPFADWIATVNAFPLGMAPPPTWPGRHCTSCGMSETACEARMVAISWPCCAPNTCDHPEDTESQASKAKRPRKANSQ